MTKFKSVFKTSNKIKMNNTKLVILKRKKSKQQEQQQQKQQFQPTIYVRDIYKRCDYLQESDTISMLKQKQKKLQLIHHKIFPH